MKREALLLYLENVRDLEVARNYIVRQYNAEKESYQVAINRNARNKSELSEIPEFTYKSGKGYLIAFLVVLAIISLSVACLILMGGIGVWHPLCVLFYVCMVSSGLMFVSVYPGTKNDQKRIYNQKVARIREENQKIQSSNNSYEQKINSLKVQWAPRANWFSSEYSKINSLLNDFYSMNIIPVQYRNLASVIYLSDYMNSCEESFQMALLSTQIEEGIRRIERKLDAIASLLVQQIYETRCLRAENKVAHDRMDKQNRQMLDRLSSVEKYSSDAAKYAQLSSNYSKASAYFSLATYLKVSNR